MTHPSPSLFDANILRPALPGAFRKLDPRLMIRNPVMFVTLVGAVLTTVAIFTEPSAQRGFIVQLALWLWFTVLFANFAEAVAEGRGKAQADSLRKARQDTVARRLRDGREEKVPALSLRAGDLVVCETGDVIPADGEVIEGIATVDEAAITGESAPVIRESGGDRSAVTGGTRVISDRIVIRVTMEPGHGFLDRMIAMVEGAKRQKTPNEIALTILLAALTIVFLLVNLRGALAATLVLTFVCGGLYPLLVFGVGQALFRDRANGSLIVDRAGVVRGSRLLGQNFSGERYFHPRPSAAGANGYDAASSGGSNLGPTSRKLRDAVKTRIETYRKVNGLPETEAVPADAVTASGSGLDPHISARNAELQAPRVAKARGIELARLETMVLGHTEAPAFGVFGEPRVNVLALNLALDAAHP